MLFCLLIDKQYLVYLGLRLKTTVLNGKLSSAEAQVAVCYNYEKLFKLFKTFKDFLKELVINEKVC